jgi:predicted acyltransferase
MASSTVDASAKSAPSTIRRSERLVSLDVYRGLTIAGMILVTDPGTYSAVYWPLLHAPWNGWTLTDMIFPSFLFISGVALTFSFTERNARGESCAHLAGHLLWRAFLLIVIGLILNGFPLFHLHTLRIPGILQRIALCYLTGGLLYLFTAAKGQRVRTTAIVSVVLGILAGYWALLKLYPVPGYGPGRLDSLGSLPAYVDRAVVFGVNHLWAYGLTPGHGVTYDPEGLLSTPAALTNLLAGILVGEGLRSKFSVAYKTLAILTIGFVLFFAGRLLDPLMPINKRLYTPSFSLLSIGFGLIAFAACYWIVDIRRWRRWTAPALVFGTNAISAFVLSTLITCLFDFIKLGAESQSVHAWGYTHLFLPWLSPVNASLAYAITIVLLNLVLIWPLYRRRVFLRV